jgi:radical SAM protein with 4Fe4S-binding SPASM domain
MAGIENATTVGFNVRVNSVATRKNVDELPQLMPILSDLGVATFSVFYCLPVGRGRTNPYLMVPPARWRRFIDEMKVAAERHRSDGMEVTVEKVFLWEDEWNDYESIVTGRGGSCLGFLNDCNYVNILADGRVYPCVCFIDEAPPLGNVYLDSLANILKDPRGWDYYWSLRKANSICQNCDKFADCRGGSRALSKFMKDDWFALDPRCTGEPHIQGFIPLCFMVRENVVTRIHSGFAEHVSTS